MKSDVYNKGSKYLFVPAGASVAELPADLDPELRKLSAPSHRSLDIPPDRSLVNLAEPVEGRLVQFVELDSAGIIREIEAKGYATRAAVIVNG